MLLAALAGLAVSLAYYGYEPDENVEDVQFRPGLERRLDPALYVRDDYVRTLDRIPSVFWTGSAAAVKATGVSPAAWFLGLYLALVAALYAAIFALALELGGSLRSAWLAFALVLASCQFRAHSLLSHSDLFRNHADQTLFAWPLLLFALRQWLRGRRSWCFALLGAAFWINPFLSASLAAVLLGAEAIEPRGRGLRPAAGRLALFLALASPMIVSIARAPAPSISSSEWAADLRLMFPFHYFPSSWPMSQWLYILGQGGTLAALFLLAFLRLKPRPELLRVAGVLAGAWIAYGVLAEAAPWRPLILFQAYRLDVLALLLAFSGTAVAMERLAGRGGAGWCWFGLLWTALANPHRTFLPLPLLAPAVLYWLVDPGSFGRPASPAGAWAEAAGGASLARLAVGLKLSVLYPLESALPFALFGLLLRRAGRGRLAFGAVLAAALLSYGELGAALKVWRRGEERRPEALEKAEIASWLSKNSRPQDLVLALPYFDDLRLASRRSMVIQAVDGNAMHWDPDFARTWKERMEDFGYRFELQAYWPEAIGLERFPLLRQERTDLPVFEEWDARREGLLLDKYRPDYVVSPYPARSPRLAFQARAGRFVLYRVENK